MHASSTGTRPGLCPADPEAGFWWAWPFAGDLRPEVSVQNLYSVRITLARHVDDVEDLVAALTDRLSLFHVMIQQDGRGRTRIVLTLEILDLWQAILLSLNAVTSAGYVPTAVAAEPAAEFEADPG
jgi:hypothetical protein